MGRVMLWLAIGLLLAGLILPALALFLMELLDAEAGTGVYLLSVTLVLAGTVCGCCALRYAAGKVAVAAGGIMLLALAALAGYATGGRSGDGHRPRDDAFFGSVSNGGPAGSSVAPGEEGASGP